MDFIIRSMKKLRIPYVITLVVAILLSPVASMLEFLFSTEVLAVTLICAWLVIVVVDGLALWVDLTVVRDIPAWQYRTELVMHIIILVFMILLGAGAVSYNDIKRKVDNIWNQWK